MKLRAHCKPAGPRLRGLLVRGRNHSMTLTLPRTDEAPIGYKSRRTPGHPTDPIDPRLG
jgi:hypothetical protein